MDPYDIHINPTREGRHIGWLGEADEVLVFTPTGDHLATLTRQANSWVPQEVPAFAPGAIDTDVVLDNEHEIREWINDALNA